MYVVLRSFRRPGAGGKAEFLRRGESLSEKQVGDRAAVWLRRDWIQKVESLAVGEISEPVPASKPDREQFEYMSRRELNEYAELMGLIGAASLPNKEAVIEAILEGVAEG